VDLHLRRNVASWIPPVNILDRHRLRIHPVSWMVFFSFNYTYETLHVGMDIAAATLVVKQQMEGVGQVKRSRDPLASPSLCWTLANVVYALEANADTAISLLTEAEYFMLSTTKSFFNCNEHTDRYMLIIISFINC
jgi:hypothetical protein